MNGPVAGKADFNGDGLVDFFYYSNPTTTGAVGQMNVVLARADGSYSSPIQTFLAGASQACHAYDLNSDGFADLACAAQTSTSGPPVYVNVFLGTGDGTFQPAIRSNLPANSYPSSLFPAAAGDINGDGHPDLILVDVQGISTYLMLGDGTGHFTGAQALTTNSSNSMAPPVVVLNDVNGDGHLDMLFTGPLQVYLGNGDGTFTRGFSNNGDAECVFADFDNDQHLDVECLDVSANPVFRNVILHGNADGSFNPNPIAIPDLGKLYSPVAARDLNGDGIPDIIGIGAGGTIVYLGKPGLQFAVPASYAFYNATASNFAFTDTLIADYNGDGALDLAIAAYDGIYISYGVGDGSFQAPRPTESGTAIAGLVVGDYNGDGIPDVITSGGASLQLNRGIGDGSFARAIPLQTTNLSPSSLIMNNGASYSLLQGDFDGDGHLDLIATYQTEDNPSLAHIFFGKGDGTFADPVLASSDTNYVPLTGAVVADFNGDGRSDMVVSTFLYPTSVLSIMLSRGDGSFVVQTIGSYASNALVSTADLNGDGKADLIVTAAGAVQIYLGNGDGTFNTVATAPTLPVIGSTPLSPGQTVAGDFDGDGKMDFALEPTFGTVLKNLAIYYGNGDGTFSAPVLAATSSSFLTVLSTANLVAHDLNGDGLDDLVLSESNTYQLPVISVMHAQKNRTFDGGTSLIAGAGSLAISIADFNRDGRPDLLFANGGGPNTFVTLLNHEATSTVLTADSGSIQYGQSTGLTVKVTLSATVATPPPPSATITLSGLPGSPITLPVSFVASGGSTPATGTVRYMTNVLLPGTYKVTAGLSGSCCLSSSTSAPLSLVVAPAATTTTVSLTPVPPLTGQPVTLRVGVSSQTTVSSGSVTFFDQGTQIGTASVSSGAAAFATAPLSAGAHSITAMYAGSMNFLPSTSQPLSITVFNSGYQLSAASTSLSLSAGSSGGTDLLTLAPVEGFLGNVSLNCSVASTDGVTSAALPACSLSPSSLSLAGAPANSTLTVSMNKTSAAVLPANASSHSWVAFGLLAFIPALFRRQRRRAWSALVAILAVQAMVLLSGCAGATGSSPAGAAAAVKSYIITISASSSMPGSAPAPLKITVQVN